MELISNNKISIGVFGQIKDELGKDILSSEFEIQPAKTLVPVTRIDEETFSVTTPNDFDVFNIGEIVFIKQDSFDIECIISEVGNDSKYRVILLKDTLKDNYSSKKMVIPEDTSNIYRNYEVLKPTSLKDGVYYTQFGGLLLLSDGFHRLKALDYNDIYSLKPVLRNKGVTPWQLNNLINTAYKLVLDDLVSYDLTLVDRFKYLNIGGIINLIMFKTIALYEKAFPTEKNYIYHNTYKSALNSFKPYLKTDNTGKVEKVRKRGFRL